MTATALTILALVSDGQMVGLVILAAMVAVVVYEYVAAWLAPGERGRRRG
jgi:hypothetical protein